MHSTPAQVIDGSNLHYRPSKDSPFRSWSAQSARVYLDFEDLDAVARSDWDVFHAHRKPQAVIAVLHCPSFADVQSGFEKFCELKSLPEFAHVRRFQCYAFETRDSKEDASFEDLVVFPDQDAEHRQFYVTTLLSDTVSLLLKSLEKEVGDVLAAKSPVPFSPADERHARVNLVKNKKLCNGRRSKHAADLCLLAGAPADALRLYKESMEPCKSAKDWIWVGGACEGRAACLLVDIGEGDAGDSDAAGGGARKGDGGSVDTKAMESVAKWLEDAWSHYRKKESLALVLRVSLAFKLLRLCTACKWFDRARGTLTALLIEASFTGAQDRIQILLEAAALSAALSRPRTAADLLYQAATIYSELQQQGHSRALVEAAAPAFGIHGLIRRKDFKKEAGAGGKPSAADGSAEGWIWRRSSGSAERLREKGFSDFRWFGLHRSLLNRFVATSTVASLARAGGEADPGDPALVSGCLGYLLNQLHSGFDAPRQLDLATRLAAVNGAVGDAGAAPGGVLQIVQVYPEPLSGELRPTENTTHDAGADGVFVYAPGAKQTRIERAKNVTWVCGEPAFVSVALSNPLAIPLSVRSLVFQTNLSLQTQPTAFTLPPRTFNHQVRVTVVPREAGTLAISGVRLGTLNRTSLHPIDADGFGRVSLSQAETAVNPLSLSRANVAEIRVAAPHPRASVAFVSDIKGLWRGECARGTLCIRNIGASAIGHADLSVKESLNPSSAQAQALYYADSGRSTNAVGEPLLDWDAKALTAALPLAPGASASIPITLRAHAACHGLDASLRYASAPDSTTGREFQCRPRWEVSRGLRVAGVRIGASGHGGWRSSGLDDTSFNLILTLQNTADADYLVSLRTEGTQDDSPPVSTDAQIVPRKAITTLLFPATRASFGLRRDLAVLRLAEADFVAARKEAVGDRAGIAAAKKARKKAKKAKKKKKHSRRSKSGAKSASTTPKIKPLDTSPRVINDIKSPASVADMVGGTPPDTPLVSPTASMATPFASPLQSPTMSLAREFSSSLTSPGAVFSPRPTSPGNAATPNSLLAARAQPTPEDEKLFFESVEMFLKRFRVDWRDQSTPRRGALSLAARKAQLTAKMLSRACPDPMPLKIKVSAVEQVAKRRPSAGSRSAALAGAKPYDTGSFLDVQVKFVNRSHTDVRDFEISVEACDRFGDCASTSVMVAGSAFLTARKVEPKKEVVLRTQMAFLEPGRFKLRAFCVETKETFKDGLRASSRAVSSRRTEVEVVIV